MTPNRPVAPGRSERPPLASSRATRTSTACAACRGRRVKCTGGPPCERCVANKIDCVVDGTLDGRRKIAVKRKLDELERDRELLRGLVRTIRMGDRSQLAQVLNLIRSDAPMDEVGLCIEDQLESLGDGSPSGSPGPSEPGRPSAEPSGGSFGTDTAIAAGTGTDAGTGIRASRSRDGRSAMSVQRLCDTPIVSVQARPWTTVTDDDGFVSHLVSLWFTWQYPHFHWLDRDMFVDDMRSGRLDSDFCSPFLVNIMLAEACPFSYYPEALATPGDSSSSGEHFYAEAKRCLEAEEGRISLTSVQGACILYTCTGLMGKDKLGSIFMNQAIHMARELGLFSTAPEPWPDGGKDVDEAALKMRTAREQTAWAIYNITTLSSMSSQRPSPLKPPRSPMPAHDHGAPGVSWSPYPRQGLSRPTHLGCLFRELCEVAHISHAIAELLFADEFQPTQGEAEQAALESIYGRLQAWYGRMPGCLALGESPLPHVLDLHMHYHYIASTICGFLKATATASPSSTPSSASSAGSRSSLSRQADQVCVTSALETAGLMDMLRRDWGLDSITVMMTQFVSVAAFILMEDLRSTASQAAFIDLCVAARSFARRWTLGKGVLRMVQQTAKEMQISLPKETAPLFEDFESRAWDPTDRERVGGGGASGSVAGAAATKPHPRFSDTVLDQLVDKWDDIMRSTAQGPSSSSSSMPPLQRRAGKRKPTPGPDEMTDD